MGRRHTRPASIRYFSSQAISPVRHHRNVAWSILAVRPSQWLDTAMTPLLPQDDPQLAPLINELGELIRQARQEAITHIREMNLGTGDIVRDPAVLKPLGMPNAGALLETDLEQALIDQLQGFLLELGKGFAFVARQQRISTESKDFYLDLVFYNYLLKCFVIIDLKRGELSHQDIGQMDMYVRLYDDLKRSPDDKPTVGIILCAQKDESVARYSVLQGNEQLFASQYKLVLPTEEELRNELDRERARLEHHKRV